MVIYDNPTINSIIPKMERQQKYEKKRKEDRFILLIKVSFFSFLLFILLLGLHLDATYTKSATITRIDTSAKEVFFDDGTGNEFSYYSDLSDEYVGEEIIVRFDHMGTESNREDDKVIGVERKEAKK